MAEEPAPISLDQIAAAEALAGLEYTPEERALLPEGLGEHRAAYAQIRAVPLPNEVPPAFRFDPRPPGQPAATLAPAIVAAAVPPAVEVTRPASLERLDFASVTELAALIRTRQVTALELTELYLARLKRY